MLTRHEPGVGKLPAMSALLSGRHLRAPLPNSSSMNFWACLEMRMRKVGHLVYY